MLLTKPQVAQELGCSLRTVDNLIQARSLKVLRLGRRMVRVRRTDLEKFVAKLAPAEAR